MADYTLTAKLLADTKGFINGFKEAQSKLENVGTKFNSIGKQISGIGDKLTKSITLPAIGAATALGSITLVKGWNRLTGIDTAQAKLYGLGHSAESVEGIMQNALDAVRGTAFGMDEAATTAANATAAGVEIGKDLTRYLTITGDAAAIAGSSMADMGSIMNKVQTAGKAYNGELQMLSERGLPIYQWLAKEAKVSEDAIFKMASNGEISTKMFLSAIENNIGGAAKIMGEKSLVAGISNIGASISRIGANFLDAGGQGGGFFSTLKPLLMDFNTKLEVVEKKAADLGVAFGNSFNAFIDKVSEIKSRFDGLDSSTQSLILKATAIGTGFLVGIGPAIKILGGLVSGFGTLTTVVGFLLSPIGLIVGGLVALGVAFGVAMAKSETFRDKVFGAFSKVQEIATSIASFLAPILSSLFDKGVEGAKTFASEIGGKLLNAFEVISSVVMTVADVVGQFVSSIMDGFKGAGGEVSTLSTLFLGFNPVLKIAMMILSQFGGDIAQGFSQMATLVTPILNTLGQALGQLAAAIIPMVMNVISTLIPIVLQLGQVVMNIVSTALPILLGIFNQLIPVIMSIVTTVIELIGQLLPLVSVVIDALVPVIMVLADSIMNIVSAVAPALIAIISAIVEAFKTIIPIVMSVLTVVINVVANIIAAITPIIAFIAGVITNIMAIISPIIAFIANIMASIFAAIRPIVSFATGVFNTVFSVVSGVFRNITSFITGSIQTVSNIISRLSGIVSGVFNNIRSTVVSIMSTVSSIITGVFSAITNSWQGLQGFVTGVFSGIGSAVNQLVGQVKGFVNGVIGGINSAIGLINKIPGVSISRIPQLQRGTDDWGGGFARMNEGGRGELVKLPNGSQVIPHDVSMRYAREAGRQQGSSMVIGNSNQDVSMNTGRIENLLEQINNRGFIFNVNGQKLAEVTKDDFDRENGRTIGMTERWELS